MKRLLILGVLLAAPVWASPNSKMKVAWDPVTYSPATPPVGISHYEVHYGPDAAYGTSVQATAALVELSDLPQCADLYVGIKAVGNNGLVSDQFSGPPNLFGWPRPFVAPEGVQCARDGGTPGSTLEGSGTYQCTAIGVNLQPGLEVAVFPNPVAGQPSPTVTSKASNGCDAMSWTMDVPEYATQVSLTVRALNPDIGLGTPFGGRPDALTFVPQDTRPLPPTNPRRIDTVEVEGSDPDAGAHYGWERERILAWLRSN